MKRHQTYTVVFRQALNMTVLFSTVLFSTTYSELCTFNSLWKPVILFERYAFINVTGIPRIK